MRPHFQKTKLVILPLLALSFCFMFGYTLLYWLLFIELRVVSLKQDVLHLWMPGSISAILVFIFIRPRVHLLTLEKNDGKIRQFYYMIAVAILFLPLLFLLRFTDTATGKRLILQHISDIKLAKNVKYYSVAIAELNKSEAGFKKSIHYSGKRNDKLNFNIYIAIPFRGKDSSYTAPAFLAIKYHKQISSRGTEEEHDIDWRIFHDRSMRDFEAEDYTFKYLERMPNTNDRDEFAEAVKKSPASNNHGAIHILTPVKATFEQRNGNNLNYLLLAIGIGWTVWTLLILITGIHTDKAKDFATGQSFNIIEYLGNIIRSMLPKKGFAATPVLIALNVLVFIIMLFSGHDPINFSTRSLLQAGALYKPLVQDGEWWRLLTAMFLHGGLMHMAMNMFSLYLGGILTEQNLGTKKFITVYLVSGIGASLFSMTWHSTPVVAVGASGAIFGIFGLMLAFALLKKFEEGMAGAVLIILAGTAGYSLLIGLVTKGIDNSAHLAGLVIGFILGCLFPGQEKLKGSTLLKFTKKTKK